MSIKITNRDKVLKGIKQETINTIARGLISDLDEDLESEIRSLINRYFLQSDTVKGIIGAFPGVPGKDLQAEFGLFPDIAESFVDSLSQLILSDNYFKIQARNEKGQFTKANVLRVTFYPDNMEEAVRIVQNNSYSYADRTREIVTLPWVDWLLDGATVDARITYSITTDAQAIASRSGRALMINGNPVWSFDSAQLSENGGRNFIQDVFQNPELRSEIEKLVKSFLTEYITKNV